MDDKAANHFVYTEDPATRCLKKNKKISVLGSKESHYLFMKIPIKLRITR